MRLLKQLSSKLNSEVQYFGTHRVVEYHAWAKVVAGEVVRAYGYVGESGETLVELGSRAPAEIRLGRNFFDETSEEAKDEEYWERTDLSYPSETDVTALAGCWSIDPTKLEDRGEVGTGWLVEWTP